MDDGRLYMDDIVVGVYHSKTEAMKRARYLASAEHENTFTQEYFVSVWNGAECRHVQTFRAGEVGL